MHLCHPVDSRPTSATDIFVEEMWEERSWKIYRQGKSNERQKTSETTLV